MLLNGPKGLVHGLVSQLDTQEGDSVSGHSSGQSRAEAGEEGLDTALSVELANDASQRDVALGSLQTRLDGIDGEDRNPHGNTGGTTSSHDGGNAQLARGVTVGVLGAKLGLDDLVRGKVTGGSGTVTGKRGKGAAEDGADATLLVKLADDVAGAAVLGLLARCELLLALDLQNNLDALKGGRDGRHGDGREETGGRDLGDGEAVGADGADVGDDLLAEIVAPEGHSD